MAETVLLEVARYRPEFETEPTFDTPTKYLCVTIGLFSTRSTI